MIVPFAALAASAQDAPPPVAAVVRSPSAELVGEETARETSFRLSVVPGVGIDADPDVAVDGIALGGISKQPSLEGMDVELGISLVDGRMQGLQASLGLSVAGEVDGLQLSAGGDWATGDVHVAQLSGFANVAEGNVDGVQATTFLNVAAGSVHGLQASMANVALGDDNRGVQLGLFDLAQDLDGVQGSLLNVADHVKGLQLGLVNVGGDVDGLQLGLVNVARTSDVSIAPLNFVGNGLHRLDVWTSESAVASGAVKFGSRHVYTLVGAGWVNPTQPWWTFGAGLGVHAPIGPAWIEVDDSVWSLAQGFVLAPGAYDKLRLQVGVDLVKHHVAPFVGVSMNTWIGDGSVAPRALGVPESRDPGNRVVTWPGFHAGISF